MTWQDALDWLDGQKEALSAEADTALAARHEQFLVEVQAALDYVWGQFDVWADTDAGYPVRLRLLMERLATAGNTYAADVTALARAYGTRAWHFSYFGQAWLLGAQLPEADISIEGRQDVSAVVGGAIEGVDLPAAIENVRIEFLQRARREMILSQSAKENYHKARARLLSVAGITEAQSAKEQVQEAARPKIAGRLQAIAAKKHRTGALARAHAAVQSTIVRAAAEGVEDIADDNAGFIDGFVWHISHFSNVCSRCMARDKKWYMEISVKPPLHVHCACYSLTQARSPESLDMVAVPGPISVRPYGEWALGAGVRYDGGLGSMNDRRAKWRGSKPKSGHPGIDRSAAARARRSAREWARKNVRPVDTEPRWGQESITVNSQSELDALLAEAAEKGWTVTEE